jgi:hypothetical protein
MKNKLSYLFLHIKLLSLFIILPCSLYSEIITRYFLCDVVPDTVIKSWKPYFGEDDSYLKKNNCGWSILRWTSGVDEKTLVVVRVMLDSADLPKLVAVATEMKKEDVLLFPNKEAPKESPK